MDCGSYLGCLAAGTLWNIRIGISYLVVKVTLLLLEHIQIAGNRNSSKLRIRQIKHLVKSILLLLVLKQNRFYLIKLKTNDIALTGKIIHIPSYVLKPAYIWILSFRLKGAALHCHYQLFLGSGECHIEKVAPLLSLESPVLFFNPCSISLESIIFDQPLDAGDIVVDKLLLSTWSNIVYELYIVCPRS